MDYRSKVMLIPAKWKGFAFSSELSFEHFFTLKT